MTGRVDSAVIQAHGLGGGSDLPIPASLAIAGGTAALTLSFVVLLLAWRTPRFATERARTVPAGLAAVVDGAAFALVLRVLGFALFAFVAWASIAGPDILPNPTFGVVYVWLWVGIVPTSLLFGRFYRAVSPARTIHLVIARLSGGDPATGIRELPAWLGWWPAAVTLFAFVWLELVYPNATYLGPLQLWFALYFLVTVVGAAVYGDRWLSRADPFEAWSDLAARLSVWGRDDDGRLVVRSPLRNLARLEPAPGLVATVAVLLGSTAFDSFREAPWWVRFVQEASVPQSWLGTGALLLTVLVVGATFTLATRGTSVDERRVPSHELPARLAHSVVPIVVGYMVAHYLTYFVEVGQLTLIQLSDPLVDGSNLFGTADWQVDYWLSTHPSFLATVKVLAIVVGHVLGVVAAHDMSLRLLPKAHQVTGQLPLLGAMVLYTFGGLYLLFGS
ncbi:hypothetical protein [Nocardioides flavescens]|uniref:hypothetical protein n=1 Tax=Nocardioides flavescens TaxID=2691959 RepID=UPI00301E2D54